MSSKPHIFVNAMRTILRQSVVHSKTIVWLAISLPVVSMIFVLLIRTIAQPTIDVRTALIMTEKKENEFSAQDVKLQVKSAISRIIQIASTTKQGSIEPHILSELPDITIPQTGLSLNFVGYEIKRLIGSKRHWIVETQILINDKKYTILVHLKNFADEAHTISFVMDNKASAQLFRQIAKKILEITDPYSLAV